MPTCSTTSALAGSRRRRPRPSQPLSLKRAELFPSIELAVEIEALKAQLAARRASTPADANPPPVRDRLRTLMIFLAMHRSEAVNMISDDVLAELDEMKEVVILDPGLRERRPRGWRGSDDLRRVHPR